MKVYDNVNKIDVEISDVQELITLMDQGRQVDLFLKEEASDEDGYLHWDIEHWSQLDANRYMRCYSWKGKYISGETTRCNKSDILTFFKPMEAAKVELS